MGTNLYILVNGEPTIVKPDTWKQWSSVPGNRCIAVHEYGASRVSTFFLGVGRPTRKQPFPLLFETTVYLEGYEEMYCARHATLADATAAHDRACTIFETNFGKTVKLSIGFIRQVMNSSPESDHRLAI